tara:strand:+ start:564 stop:773 length:210 start_codon:yes stop_codon:yes gene_type:complete
MKIGDLVILRTGRYNFASNAKARWEWTDVMAVVTDARGLVDGTAECRVYTVDGKHTWSHVDDLRLVEKP